MATKEQKYAKQLEAMGIWNEAFAGAVHDLAILEREQSRTRKAWAATAEDGQAPSPLDEHYQLILQQGRDILRLREALGLTPKSYRRLRGDQTPERPRDEKRDAPTVLDLVRARQKRA